MLEEIEMRFILTDVDGKLIGCYSEFENAELDAKDMVEGENKEKKYHIYEIMTAQTIGVPYLMNIYELRKSIPEIKPEDTDSESS